MAKVKASPDGTGWVHYNLTVCEQNNSTLCLPGSPFKCNVNTASQDGTTDCPITGAQASTNYTVAATAFQANGTISTLASAGLLLTTTPHPCVLRGAGC